MVDRLRVLAENWAAVHTTDPIARRRGQILGAAIGGVWVLLAVLILIDVVRAFAVPSPSHTFYVLADAACGPILFGLWAWNRTGHTRWAATVFLAALVLIPTLTLPVASLDRSLVVYALPILLASFTILPAASFGFALLSVLVYSLCFQTQGLPATLNYLDMLALIGMAYISWMIADRLEDALASAHRYQAELQQDIAERKQAEEVLRIRNIALEASEGAFAIADLQGKITYVNPAFVHLWGYSAREELLGSPLTKLWQNTDLFDRIISELTGAGTWTGELATHKRDGTPMDVRLSANLVTDASGAPLCLVGSLVDISAHKRAERVLRGNEEQLRRRLEMISSPAVEIASQDLKTILDLPALQDLFDAFYDVTQIGAAIMDLEGHLLVGAVGGRQDICVKFHRVHPQTRQNCIESDVEMSQSVRVGEALRYRCKNNLWSTITPMTVEGKHFANLYIGQFLFEDEVPDRAYFAAQAERYGFDKQAYLEALDRVPRRNREQVQQVTTFYTRFADMISRLSYKSIVLAKSLNEQKLVQQALAESEERLRLALAAANQGLFDSNIQTGEAKTNPEYATMLGFDPATFVETSDLYYARTHPDDRERVHAAYRACIAGETPIYRVECRQATRSGDWRWILSLGKLVAWDADGKPLRMLGTHTDITDRKRAEETLRDLNAELERRVRERTAQLEASNKELEAFAYSVSHDLRAPLRGIDGFSLALLEEFGNRLDERGRHYLERVRSGTQRMGLLIDDLLKLSRVTRSTLVRTRVDLSRMVTQMAAELQAAQPGRQVEWIIAPEIVADGDLRLLEAALRNLLENAWKFTSRHPTARIEFGAHEDGGQCVYYVRDDGAGFDMAYADRLFGAFQRLHRAEEFEGTGIGLAIVQRIVSRHGGRVWAEGAAEQGATFYFTLADGPLTEDHHAHSIARVAG